MTLSLSHLPRYKAMLLFLAAVSRGAWLVLRIVMQDHRQQRP